MTLLIPYAHWFTVSQWFTHNYFDQRDYSHVHIQDMIAITFVRADTYARFYTAWQHIICVDNEG